jgi:hypothetical protein
MFQTALASFHDPAAIVLHASTGPLRQVPGYGSLLQMTDILLA